MTENQIIEAIDQVKVTCELKMANYDYVSMRGALYELGYDSDQADEVIRYCADKGFNYCLDSQIGHKVYGEYPNFTLEYPTQDVCHWGPDQLLSRLDCVTPRRNRY